MWNYKKFTAVQLETKLSAAKKLVDYAMWLAKLQYDGGRAFAYEHPSRATSWQLDSVSRVKALRGVQAVTFDMCMFGLCSPRSKTPCQKTTTVLTNSLALAKLLEGHKCDKSHAHMRIQGSEGGITLSKWCQKYRPAFCQAVVNSLA